MKKVNFKKVLVALVAVFALMFVGVEKAEAQTVTTSGFTNSGAVTFLGVSEAQDVLMTTMTTLKNDAILLVPGSPASVAISKVVIYYQGIYDELGYGKDVPTAINQGIYSLNDGNGFGQLPSSEYMELRLGAIDLLKQ